MGLTMLAVLFRSRVQKLPVLLSRSWVMGPTMLPVLFRSWVQKLTMLPVLSRNPWGRPCCR